MAVPGSWSGAIIAGLLFGCGMILARGCSGRLLVLAAKGNLRSVVAGPIFAVTAQMSLHGQLSDARSRIAAPWVTPGGRNTDLLGALHIPASAGLLLGLAMAALALALAWRGRIGPRVWIFASGVGFAVALGWVLIWSLARIAFDPVPVTSATFSGPSAHTLMFLLDRAAVLDFDVGLVPGVVTGALVSALLAGRFHWQASDGVPVMRSAMIGAVMMGLGAMLAGGCAIGAVATLWLAAAGRRIRAPS